MTRRAILSGLALLGSISVCACSQSTEPVEYHMDYPSYRSVAEMCEVATHVIVATPGASEVRSVNLAMTGGDTAESDPLRGATSGQPSPDMIVVETVTTMVVDLVVKGEGLAAGEYVDVGQPGGVLDGVRYVADQAPVTTAGQFLLFLQYFPDETTAPAHLLNPGQAAVEVAVDGTLTRLPSSSPAVPGLSSGKLDPGVCG